MNSYEPVVDGFADLKAASLSGGVTAHPEKEMQRLITDFWLNFS
jgi:hypothetical protein